MPYTITLLYPKDIANLFDNEKIPPPHIIGNCQKCGRCCTYFHCPALDTVTHLCKVYGNRPTVCRQWPLLGDDIAMVNCNGYHVEDEQ